MHSRVLSPSPIPSSHSGYILEPVTVETDVNPNPASQILPLFHALYSPSHPDLETLETSRDPDSSQFNAVY